MLRLSWLVTNTNADFKTFRAITCCCCCCCCCCGGGGGGWWWCVCGVGFTVSSSLAQDLHPALGWRHCQRHTQTCSTVLLLHSFEMVDYLLHVWGLARAQQPVVALFFFFKKKKKRLSVSVNRCQRKMSLHLRLSIGLDQPLTQYDFLS